MSYESEMLAKFAMPTQSVVEQTLLRALLRHGGVIKEFGDGEDIVDEMAAEFGLNKAQRSAVLETVYRKENRVKRASLWHRLLFRAAAELARKRLVSRPTQTVVLTDKREWMLTEEGYDRALALSGIPIADKETLPIKSYEVEKVVNTLREASLEKPFDPFDLTKKKVRTTRESVFRRRGFRQAVVEAYDYTCAVCGLSIRSPDQIYWEVQAAHIVPNRSFGSDDLRNGLALCGLHHWAFDVGWFTLRDDYRMRVSDGVSRLPNGAGRLWQFDTFHALVGHRAQIRLPKNRELSPHPAALEWHRINVFR